MPITLQFTIAEVSVPDKGMSFHVDSENRIDPTKKEEALFANVMAGINRAILDDIEKTQRKAGVSESEIAEFRNKFYI